MSKSPSGSRVQSTVDLDRPGRQVGDIMLRWSDNSVPLGFHAIPLITLARGRGRTVLMLGGVHGDEFEGPAALMRLAEGLRAEDVNGRVIIIPALNAPALGEGSRTSPLDGGNLNRAFPGDADGDPTAMIAHYVEAELISRCDAVIDLHAGGRASVFAPCTLAARADAPGLFEENLSLARAFSLPTVWILGAYNDDRSVNSAALRCGVPMIAAELGGGGGVDPNLTELAERGLLRCLETLGVLASRSARPAATSMRMVEIAGAEQVLHAPARGLFDRGISAGHTVSAGAPAGRLHFVEEPERPSCALAVPSSGFVLAHTNRGIVERGELLAMIAQEIGTVEA